MGQGAGLAFHLNCGAPEGSWWCRCWKVLVWPGRPCCAASWHGVVGCGAGLLGNVCAEGRSCPFHHLCSTPGQLPLDQSPSPPALAVGPRPPAWGRTLVPHCGQSQWGISHHLCLGHTGIFVVFFTQQRLSCCFFLFVGVFFISILVKTGDVLYGTAASGCLGGRGGKGILRSWAGTSPCAQGDSVVPAVRGWLQPGQTPSA